MNLFSPYRKLTEEEQSLVDAIKDGSQDLFRLMETAFNKGKNNGRELALAKTNLEQSVLWAVKAISATVVQEKTEEPVVENPPQPPKEEEAKSEETPPQT